MSPRGLFDLETRASFFSGERNIAVPRQSLAFWTWYAKTLRPDTLPNLIEVGDVPDYPEPVGETAIWYSGGVESTYTLEHIRREAPVLLRIEDYPVFSSRHRRIGQIHFLCAVLSASLGFKKTYMGVERNDLLLAHSPPSRCFLERAPAFLDAWSEYQPNNRMVTICGQMHKEEVLKWLWHRNIRITGTCDRFKNGTWCGDCFKCFELFYAAKAIGFDLGFKLTRRGFDQYFGEYDAYVVSGFRNNINNAYASFARLQILYHLAFDPENDCSDHRLRSFRG